MYAISAYRLTLLVGCICIVSDGFVASGTDVGVADGAVQAASYVAENACLNAGEVVAIIADSACSKILAVKALVHCTFSAKDTCQEIVSSVVTLQTSKFRAIEG